jgi:DNA-binding Lrp family transcriptional regulator
LESAGYICGYEARVDMTKFADSVTVFTEVTLSDHKRADFVKFESYIRGIDEVLECHLISGGYDYLLRFMTGSIQHYQELMESILDRNIGIEKYFSYIVIKSPVVKNAVPLRILLKAI